MTTVLQFYQEDLRDNNGSIFKPMSSSGTSKELDWISGLDIGLTYMGDSTLEVRRDMTNDVAELNFFRYISKLHFVCRTSARFGKLADGGWDVCLELPYLPAAPCLVYSFGISYDFSFDDAIQSKFNCMVRSFDPSMKQEDHERRPLSWFYNLGLYGHDHVNQKGWKLMTLQSIMKQFNETNKVIDYLKFDIEHSEWAAITSMVSTGALKNVRQLALEIHVTSLDKASFYGYYRVLKSLEDAGMRRWYFAMNYYNLRQHRQGTRSGCYEMAYINANFLTNWTNSRPV
jgi:hypothetical protein